MKISTLVNVFKNVAQNASVIGLLACAVSCADFNFSHPSASSHVEPLGDAELSSLISGISPMAKRDAADLLQKKSVFNRADPDDDEKNFSTTLVTTETFTDVVNQDTAARDPLFGMVLAHKLKRSTYVFAWKDSTVCFVDREVLSNGKPVLRIYVGFSVYQHREESSSGGPFKVDSDVVMNQGALPWLANIALVGDAADFPLSNLAAHEDLIPIVSAIKSLTGLTPKAAAPGQ